MRRCLIYLMLTILPILGCGNQTPEKKEGVAEVAPEQIQSSVQKDKEAMLAFLAKAVQYKSVEDFGFELTDETKDLMAFVFDAAVKMGFSARLAAGGLVGVLEYGEGAETVGVLIHLDVVPVSEEELSEWEQPPFEGKIVDEVLWGRGSQDDKGALAGVLYGAKTLIDNDLAFKRKLRIVLGTKEEKNFEAMTRYLKEEPQPDYGLVPDGVYIVQGQKGIVDLSFRFSGSANTASTRDRVVHWQGGAVINTVPDFSFLVIKSDDPTAARSELETLIQQVTDELKSGASERFYGVTESYEANLAVQDYETFVEENEPGDIPAGDLVIYSKGVAVHGSMPWLGENALIEVALVGAVLDQIPDDAFRQTFKFLAEKIGLSTDGSGLGIPFTNPEDITVPPGISPERYTGSSTNPGVVTLGQGEVTLGINIRIGLSNSVDEVLAACREAAASFQGEIPQPSKGEAYDSYYIPGDDALLGMVKETYKTANQRDPILTVGSGANYMMLVKNFVSYGPVDFFLPDSSNFDPTLIRFHQKNERFEVRQLERNVIIFALTLQKLLQTEKAPSRAGN